MDLNARTEARRVSRSARLGPERATLGQFFTPEPAAVLIASMVELSPTPTFKVLDPGAGVGSLAAALVARAATEIAGTRLVVDAVEVDKALAVDLDETLDECRHATPGEYRAHYEDFTTWASGALRHGQRYDLVIMNPPYRKMKRGSSEELAFRRVGVETTNLYAGFMTLGLRLLAPGGQLVTITPRSFANGTYFKRFRRELLDAAKIQRIHVFHSRKDVFNDADVLQENVIAVFRAGAVAGDVSISSSRGYLDAPSIHVVPYSSVVPEDDPDAFIRIATDAAGLDVAEQMAAMPSRLEETGVEVMTGRVVDFRAAKHLRPSWTSDVAPLVYPGHLRSTGCRWPEGALSKPTGIEDVPATRWSLVPRGHYVVVNRRSAKEEPRRVVACLVRPEDLPGDWWGFENHLNVFHVGGEGLPEVVAETLASYLNGDLVDAFVRLFNGHTQINAGDLRSLRYPAVKVAQSVL